jgi:hypothetical protein
MEKKLEDHKTSLYFVKNTLIYADKDSRISGSDFMPLDFWMAMGLDPGSYDFQIIKKTPVTIGDSPNPATQEATRDSAERRQAIKGRPEPG